MVFDLARSQLDKYIYQFDKVNKNCPSTVSHCRPLIFEQFMYLAQWKSYRPLHHYEKIYESDIRAVSKLCFSTENEYVRIHSLQSLHGVGWPIASVILHFAYWPYEKEKIDKAYPILDIWAMRAVGEKTNYSFDLWQRYTTFCRQKAKEYNICMRDLDKALWAYGKFGKDKEKR